MILTFKFDIIKNVIYVLHTYGGKFMKYMTSSEIRQMWLDFFKSKGHLVEPSASLVPVNDPILSVTKPLIAD